MIVAVSWFVEWKFIKICVERYCQRNFTDSEYLCKLGKEYLNTPLCKFYTFFWTKLANFWHITRLSTTNHCKVINVQKCTVFIGPPCILYWIFTCLPYECCRRLYVQPPNRLFGTARRMNRHFGENQFDVLNLVFTAVNGRHITNIIISYRRP